MAMLRQQVTDFLDNGKMETTLARAKEIKPLAEKMITLGKKSDLAAYRQAMSFITREDVCKKLFKEIAPEYAERNGGLHPHHPHRRPPWRCSGDRSHRTGEVKLPPTKKALLYGGSAIQKRAFCALAEEDRLRRRFGRSGTAFPLCFPAKHGILSRKKRRREVRYG